MAQVTLDRLRKVYPNGFVGVADASFTVADGELLVLVGPSGCGKSTLLRMIAGLETISSGELRIGERVVNDMPPKDRDIAMVFQSYALYPNMNVAGNISFGLEMRNVPRAERDAAVAAPHVADRKCAHALAVPVGDRRQPLTAPAVSPRTKYLPATM